MIVNYSRIFDTKQEAIDDNREVLINLNTLEMEFNI